MERSCKKIVRVLFDGKVRYGFLNGAVVELADGAINELCATGDTAQLSACKLLAPVGDGKLLIVAHNYTEDHLPDRTQLLKPAVLALKPTTSVIGPGDDIIYPSDVQNVHYEAEVGVVIGKTAKHVSAETAMQYVLGYTLVNDVTDRDKLEGQWTFGKGRDTFLPIGPCVVTNLTDDEQYAQGILNGETVQMVDTKHLNHSVAELIAWISSYMTLLPGDLICTGTSHGGGELHVDDEFVVFNEHIGELRNRVVRE